MPNAKELLRRLLLRLPVCLLCRQGHALLLLGRAKRLPVALLIDVPQSLPGCKVLLLRQNGLGNATAITTKSAAANLLTKHALPFLLLLLPQSLIGGLRHSFGERRHISADIQAAGRDLPRTSKAKTRCHTLIRLGRSLGASNVLSRRSLQWRGSRLTAINVLRGRLIIRLGLGCTTKQCRTGSLIIRLRGASSLADIGDTSHLCGGERSDKLAAIWGEGLLRDLFGASIYRIISGQNLWRDGYRGGTCAALTTTAHDASFQPPVWA